MPEYQNDNVSTIEHGIDSKRMKLRNLADIGVHAELACCSGLSYPVTIVVDLQAFVCVDVDVFIVLGLLRW